MKLTTVTTELRARPGGELQVDGSGALVDEITLLTAPVIVGQGTRLFADAGADSALELVESRTTPRVIIQVYRPTGRPEYATASED